MNYQEYYSALLAGLPTDLTVKRVVHGISWTGIQLSSGSAGVAMHTTGESRPRMFESLEGLTAAEAGKAALSWNFEEASEGLAVINAFYNTPANREALCPGPETGPLSDIDLTGRTIGMIGHLIGHGGTTDEMLVPAKAVYIMEKEPRSGDYPDSACEYLLPKCDLVMITGSAAVNKTMPRLLELCAGKEVILTGPTVTLCPALKQFGISRLNGSVITDPNGLLDMIPQKKMGVGHYARYFTLNLS